MFKNLKKAINNFLEKLAKENKEAFGRETLDCCKLNQQSNKK